MQIAYLRDIKVKNTKPSLKNNVKNPSSLRYFTGNLKYPDTPAPFLLGKTAEHAHIGRTKGTQTLKCGIILKNPLLLLKIHNYSL